MKIIVHGKLPEEYEYRCICSHCRCVFEFKQKEANTVYDQRDGNSLTIDCPTCKKTVYVTENSRINLSEHQIGYTR